MDWSACFSILLLLTSGAPLVSSVPRLLVNNAGSNASGTVLSPQVGSPLAVWCWTEQNEATNRQWLYRNGTQIAQFSDDSATSASVYVLKFAEMTFVKILKFRSYQTLQAGRYDCRIVLTDSGATTISLPIYIGTPPKVGGINITLSWTNTIPSLTVSWEAVTYSSAVMYNVYYTDMLQDQPVSTNTASADGLSTAFFESILACTTYYVWVSAISINTQLEGPFGDRATTDSSEAPDQVDIPTVTRTVNNRMVGLDVSWMPPESSCTVNSYDIQYRQGTDDGWSTESTMSTLYLLSGLPYGSTYQIQVRAVSDDREGPWSNEVQEATYNVPGQVSGVVLTRIASTGNGGTTTSLIASWTSPDSSLPITSYSVQYKRSGDSEYTTIQVNEGGASSSEIPGLQSATEYTVRIAAVNQLGTGSYSVQISTTTYGYGPAPPTVTATPLSEPGKIRVSWTPPTPPTGSTITGYSIQYRIGSSGDYTTATDPGRGSTSTIISGLQLGRTYQVRVGAKTEIGVGTNSYRVTQETIYAYAPPPPTVTASPLSERGKIQVSWTPPTPPTGSTITGYSIQYRIGSSGDYTTATDPGRGSTSTTISGLQLGRTYQVRVGTRTEIGVGTNSYGMPQSAVTVYNVPSPISTITLAPSQNGSNTISLRVAWDEPRSDVSITQYEGNYRVKSSGSWTGAFTTSNSTRGHTYWNLDSGQKYEARVRAVSVIGKGSYTIKSTAVPDQPNVTINSYNHSSIHLTWTRGGADDFIIYYGYAETTLTSHAITSTQYTITALESNTEYSIRISGRNALGRTNSSVKTVSTLPAAPMVILTTLSSTSIKVQWTPSPNSDLLPLTYHVNYTGVSRSTTSTTLTLTGLHPYEEYTISVQAGNRAGLSVPVTGTARTYSDKPSSPPRSHFTAASSRWCILQWRIPEEIGRNGVILKYIIELGYGNGIITKWNITHELVMYNFSFPADITHNLTSLTPNTTYMWRVAAATVNGTGPLSKSSTSFITLQDVPGPVSKLAYSVQSNTSAVVMWSRPKDPNGILLWYAVYIAKLDGSSNIICNVSHSEVLCNHFSCQVNDLDIYTPYTVTVRAATAIGIGEVSSITLFTLERDVQVKDPQSVICQNNNSTAIIIGTLLGGIAVGILATMSAVGIVCRACKLQRHKLRDHSQMPSPADPTPNNKVDAIYEKVDEVHYTDVQMSKNPAYENVTFA